jgi:TolB-like protein
VDIAGKLPPGTTLAVVSFASESPGVSDYLMEELDFALAGQSFTVADRANLAAVRKELKFQVSGEVSDETAQSIGKFLGAEYVVTGQFRLIGDAYRLRVTAERTETAGREVTTSIDVQNDAALQKLVAALKSSSITTHEAGY